MLNEGQAVHMQEYPIGDEPHGKLCNKSNKEEISKWPAAEFAALGAVVMALQVEFEGNLPPCVTYTNVDKVMQHALRNKRRTVTEWHKNNPNKLCSSQIKKETEAYKQYVILRWTKGINFVPPEWGQEYKRGRDFWQARVAAEQPSDEAAAPSLTVPPVMVEQLQTMFGSLAPGFMDAYGVQEATVMTSIQGVLDTNLHKFQALLAELMEGVHKDLEAKTSVGQQQDLDPGHQAGETQQLGAEGEGEDWVEGAGAITPSSTSALLNRPTSGFRACNEACPPPSRLVMDRPMYSISSVWKRPELRAATPLVMA
ncbi:hypothetical protein V8C86DRAFT_2438506 [Haematococcus lacustris]